MQLFQGRLLRAPCTYPRSKTTGNRKLKADSKEPEKYGDQICGVETDSIRLQTRLQQWRIQNVCSKNTNQLNDEAQSIHTRAAATVGAHFAAQPPWSSVNNST